MKSEPKILADLDFSHIPQPALIAVSGGGDSVALAQLCAAQKISFAIMHIRHGEEPWQFRAEQRAKSLAELLNVPFHLAVIDAPKIGGQGREARARKARYAALSDVIETFHYASLLTAHTLDDFVETVAIAEHRKQGFVAQSSIPSIRNFQLPSGPTCQLIRPLLHITRTELRNFLKNLSVEWIEDPTNQDPSYSLRARFRCEWRQLSPSEYESVTQNLLSIAAEAEQRIQRAQHELEQLHFTIHSTSSSECYIETNSLLDASSDAVQIALLLVGRNLSCEIGGVPRGHRTQFESSLKQQRWGARGDLGKRIHYRVTKRQIHFIRKVI